MEDIALIFSVVLFFICGYFIIKKVDLFIWNNVKNKCEEVIMENRASAKPSDDLQPLKTACETDSSSSDPFMREESRAAEKE